MRELNVVGFMPSNCAAPVLAGNTPARGLQGNDQVGALKLF